MKLCCLTFFPGSPSRRVIETKLCPAYWLCFFGGGFSGSSTSSTFRLRFLLAASILVPVLLLSGLTNQIW